MEIVGFWEKYKKGFYWAIAAIVLFSFAAVANYYYLNGQINASVQAVKDKWNSDNRAILDNLAILKNKTRDLDSKYRQNKKEIDILKTDRDNTTTTVFNSDNTAAIAKYFDETIDNTMLGQ